MKNLLPFTNEEIYRGSGRREQLRYAYRIVRKRRTISPGVRRILDRQFDDTEHYETLV